MITEFKERVTILAPRANFEVYHHGDGYKELLESVNIFLDIIPPWDNQFIAPRMDR